MNLKTTLVFIIFSLYTCNAYRILAIFPFHGRSHMAVLRQVAKALASKEHQVDVISHFPLEKPIPNYNDIVQLKNVQKYASIDYKTMSSMDEEDKWIYKKLKNICDYVGLPEVQNLIKSQQKNTTYDLILVHYLSGYQCFPAIGYLLDLPVVGVITTSLYPWMHGFVGDPLNTWLYPSNLRPWENENMTFWGRLYNVIITHRDISEYYKNAVEQQQYMERYLGPGLPDFRELEKRTSLLLSNSHYTYHGIKPKTPAIIEMGGIHIYNDTTSIDVSLKKILDESKDGFIYFSFGSMAIIETLPKEFLERFYAAFKKISPVRIILKASNPKAMPKNVPNNVFMYPWLPQQKILQHPNIKGFVTHGGALGTQEALYYAVPMICIPLFAEQILNCDILAHKKIALKLKIQSAEQNDYEYAFKEIITNPQYKKTIDKVSSMYRDRPRTPAEEVVYWIEYVIRHGKNALRSPALDLAWWQVELLDVYAFLALSFVISMSVIIFIIHKLLILLISMTKFTKKNTRTNKKLD